MHNVSATTNGGHMEGHSTQTSAENSAVCWASFLTGVREITLLIPSAADERLRAWWMSGARESYKSLAEQLKDLPDHIIGVPSHNLTQSFVHRLTALATVLTRLAENEAPFDEAMSEVAAQFGGDLQVGMAWPRSMENMASLTRWLPGLSPAIEYVRSAVPTGIAEIDRLRSALLEAMEHPQRWLHAADREAFDQVFRDFKPRYMERYAERHDESVGTKGGLDTAGDGLDAAALRNLEMLSRLAHTDRKILERIRIAAAWRRARRCALPVRLILERYPRCYCNFHPAASPGFQMSAAQINDLIGHGIDLVRTSLRRCSTAIIAALKSSAADESDAKQVAALLSQGPMINLRSRTVEILNAIVIDQPGWFQR